MKIYCPQCHTCYEIDAGLIPEEGKKLRCVRCGEVWVHSQQNEETETPPADNNAPQNVIANSEDKIIATPAAPEEQEDTEEKTVSDDEMSLIFSHLREESRLVEKEIEELPAVKKIFPKVKKLLGWNSYLTISIEVLMLLIIAGLSIFAGRYEIVRRFPQTEQFFERLSVPSKVIGEGLEFQNIVRSYNDDEKPDLLTIKGFIANKTDNELSVPTVIVNMLDTQTQQLARIEKKLDVQKINPHHKKAFTLQVNVPQGAKYIVLTFNE